MKKGQAAMEFLMTYGWAILAAVVAIGVLAYFGVFSPGKYISDSCLVSAPLGCNPESAAINSPASVSLSLNNGGGEDYYIDTIVVSGCTADAGVIINGTTGSLIKAGQQGAVISVSCTSMAGVGNKFKGDITVKFHRGTNAQNGLQASGSITSKVR